jgi:D-galactarolactone cycloisomerase
VEAIAVKVESVRVIQLTFPHPEGHRWEKGEVSALGWDQVIVEIRTDDGLVGYGESYHMKNPYVIAAAIRDTFAPMLIGRDPFAVEQTWQNLFQRTQQLGSAAIGAISGIDTALHDIIAKSLGIPLYKFLGGSDGFRARAYVGGHALGWREMDNLDDLIAEARRYVDAGFRALKLRGGRALPNPGDLESVRALRDAFGDSIDILVDANGEYLDYKTARRMAEVLAEYDVYWLESPFTFSTAFHPEDLAHLSADSPIRIASGGSTFGRFGLQRLLDAGGSDIIMANVAKAGGISEMRKLHAMISAHNGKFSPHTDGGVNAYSNLHSFAAAPPHIIDGMYFEWDPVWPFELAFRTPPKLEDGWITVPDVPGLGVELVEGVEEEYAMKPGTWFKQQLIRSR